MRYQGGGIDSRWSASRPIVLATVLVAVLAACGETSDGNEPAGSATATPTTGPDALVPPADIADAGKIVVCTDPTYPPVEFYDEDNNLVGSEIEIVNELAARMGIEADYRAIAFAGIISALQGGQCDVVASGLFVTPEREAEIEFAKYMRNGDSLMVQDGNPHGITGFDESLAGLKVGHPSGYSSVPDVQEFCRELDPTCEVVLYPTGTEVAQAVQTGRVEVGMDGATSISYRVAQNEDVFDELPEIVFATEVGLGVEKDATELAKVLQEGIDALYADGTMCEILNKWGIGYAAAEGQSC